MLKTVLPLLKAKAISRKRGSKELMLELGFCIVGVVLLVVFRTEITSLLTTLSSFVSEKIQSLFTTM